ncbi:hypothetical protein LJ739_09745 [Aestuariibacter halophilus]|uniref:SnoaL-like domain-containing protein n=1 Tax=Fluctibacter halophilus TaxID=226011 RepID=A0ABS8G7F9_9ALTE|nr:hypothetical protein [Aestuariibacter halophilus]MCC2616522.1 hypothetical protein [Aestuariibacter halophilus]
MKHFPLQALLSLFICLLAALLPAHAAADDDALIQRLFANYMEKYNHYIQHGELNREPDLYHAQVMLMSPSGSPNVVTSAVLYDQVQGFLDRLKGQGVASVNWESVSVKPLGENMAVVSNVAVRYRDDGSVHNRVGATYFVSKLADQWRIGAFAVHTPDSPPQGEVFAE